MAATQTPETVVTQTADAPTLDLWRLRFRDSAVEARYQAEQMARSLPFVRVSIALGVALYACFGILDWIVVAPEALPDVLGLRFGLALPVLLAVLVLTWTSFFERYTQAILVVTPLISGLAILGMIVATQPPVSYVYYAGLIMCVIYCSALVRMHPATTLWSSVILMASYTAWLLVRPDTPTWVFASHLFFLGMSCGVGVFTSYGVEWLVRDRFIKNEELAQETVRAQALQQQAERANAAKTEFLATMSHELRTPLNAVIGFSEIIKTEALGPVGARQYKEYAADIYDSGQHLQEIISDILDITKAEAGTIELVEDEVSLDRLLERVRTMTSDQARKKGLLLEVTPSHGCQIIADPKMLRQALINLLTNAIKFTREGEVRLAVSARPDGGIDIAVSDTGIGLSQDDRERIFEPFTQVDGAYSRDNGGVGLGLPLVRKIAELHGGSVRVDSNEGAGSTFTLSLPGARVTERPLSQASQDLEGVHRQAC